MLSVKLPCAKSSSANAIWYGNFEKHAVNGGKGKGALSKGQQQQYTYTAATIVALC